MADPYFSLEALTTLAANTPSSVVLLSGMSKHLVLSALSELENLANWGEDLSDADTDTIEAAVARLFHEIVTNTGRTDEMSMSIHARAHTGSAQSIPTATVTNIGFTTRDFDTHNAMILGTPWSFVCPAAGFYRITPRITFTPTAWPAGAIAYLYLGLNAVSIRQVALFTSIPLLNVGNMLQGVETILLKVGDIVTIPFQQTSGANVSIGQNLAFANVAVDQVG